MELLWSSLGLGLLLGLKHALDADHVVAVSTIVSEHPSPLRAALVGAFWGLGHTSTLLLVGLAVIVFRLTIPDRLALGAEFAVGVMLVVLGLLTVKGYRDKKVHLHVHQHGWRSHPHFHSHEQGRDHEGHPHRLPRRAGRSYLVGLVHGLAGGAALMVLVLATIPHAWLGLLYIAVFGLGSITAMLAGSLVLSLPFVLSVDRFGRANAYITLAAGLLSIGLGLLVMGETGSTLL